MSKKNVSLLITFFLVIYYYLNSSSSNPDILGTQTPIPEPTVTAIVASTLTGSFLVTKVVDGDTIKVEGGGEIKTVRLIGVDTPETVDPRKDVQCYGLEASAFTKSLVEGKTVTLATDATQQLYDRYGRWLAYVSLSDGTLVNEQIIRYGYGYEYTYDVPYINQKKFREAQSLAEKEGIGLWSTKTCQGKP